MPTAFDPDREKANQAYREGQADTVLDEIMSAGDTEYFYGLISTEAYNFIGQMDECECKGITEGQLAFLRSIRDQLKDKGVL